MSNFDMLRGGSHHPGQPLRVLFLCAGNSARSQIADALLHKRGTPQFVGNHPRPPPVDAVRQSCVMH